MHNPFSKYFPKQIIFLLDSNFYITFEVGEGMPERGNQSDVFVGKYISAFFDNKEKHYSYSKRVLQGEAVTFTDFVLKQHFEFTATPMPDKDGNGSINCILFITRKITKQVKLEDELKQYTANLQEAQQLAKLEFWEYYPDEKTMVWSESMYSFFSLKPSEPIPDREYFR